MGRAQGRGRRRILKNVPRGIAFIKSTFNNTMVTITDPNGNAITWSSGGTAGFTGSRKATAFAAQRATEVAARKAADQGLRQVEAFVRGPGAGRETVLRALQSRGFKILSIKDTTPMPHNGSRPPKKRRV